MSCQGQEHLPLGQAAQSPVQLGLKIFSKRSFPAKAHGPAPRASCTFPPRADQFAAAQERRLQGQLWHLPSEGQLKINCRLRSQDLYRAPSPCWGHTIITRSKGSLSWGSCHCTAGAAIPLKGSGFLFHSLPQPSAQTQFFKKRVSEHLMLHLPSFVSKS